MEKYSRREIEREYKKLVARIEKEAIYDGRDTYDEYVCDACGHKVFTTYKDKGVTPFCMPCEHCHKGIMMHRNTYRVKPEGEVKQWVRPTLKQVFKLRDRDMIEHVLKGGLILEENLKKE